MAGREDGKAARRPDPIVIARELMNGPVAVVACRDDWTIEWANASAVRLLGADPTGRKLADFVNADAGSGDAAASSLMQFKREGGDLFWAFTAQSETLNGHVLQIFEADAYVRARDLLAYKESTWRHAIEAAEHGVWDYNANNEALSYSDAWKTMRGFRLDAEFHDSNEAWEARLHPDDLLSVREHLRQHNSGEISHFNFEYRERRLDGRWIWILARGRTVAWDENGKPARQIGTDIDITKIKDEEAARAAQAEVVYRQHLAELEAAHRAAEAARQEAYALARLDPLSNLANRRAFGEEIERLANEGTSAFAVLLVDLDRFKPINDMYGHAVGDLVIKECGRRLAEVVGGQGVAARLGGDEFGVVLVCPEAGMETTAGACAERLIADLSRPISIDDFAVEIGASVGLAAYPAHSDDPHALFRYADMALYEAKLTARGTWQPYSRALGQSAEWKAALESEVRRAVAEEEIQAYFQPIVDLRSGKVAKFEMLARWQHPTHGMVTPDRFIPIIEQYGLMSEFSLSMLRRGCLAAKAWPSDISMSINLTTEEVCDPATPLRILGAAVECDFPTTRLEVEITEKALVKDFSVAKRVVAALRGAGVKILLDDFGAGYSGLGYLRELAFDCIKIDRTFISTLPTQIESRKIIKAIQGLAESLDLTTVAEGVENKQILDAVNGVGCTYGQGYFFAKAMPAGDVAAFLNARQNGLQRAG